MKRVYKKVYRFNVPSELSLDWLFEFQCRITVTHTQPVVCFIEESTIGSGPFELKYTENLAQLFMSVWVLCSRLALGFAEDTNAKDAAAKLRLDDGRPAPEK